MSIIIENGPGEEPVQIEIDNRRKGNITINGNEIKGLKDGDKTVMVEKLEEAPTSFFFDPARERTFLFPDPPSISDIPFPEASPEIADQLHRELYLHFPGIHELEENRKQMAKERSGCGACDDQLIAGHVESEQHWQRALQEISEKRQSCRRFIAQTQDVRRSGITGSFEARVGKTHHSRDQHCARD